MILFLSNYLKSYESKCAAKTRPKLLNTIEDNAAWTNLCTKMINYQCDYMTAAVKGFQL